MDQGQGQVLGQQPEVSVCRKEQPELMEQSQGRLRCGMGRGRVLGQVLLQAISCQKVRQRRQVQS